MKKRSLYSFFSILCFSTCLLLTLRTACQVTLQVQLPPSGVVQKSQLWNLAIINGTGLPSTSVVELSIYDSRNNTRVLTATSSPVSIPSGAKQFTLNSFAPVQYQFLNPMYQVDASQNGLLPVGIFKVCYSIINNGSKNDGSVAEECRELEVSPLSPPVLATPVDSSVLKNKYPQFTWIPPAPLQLFKNLLYEIRVAEVMPGQNSSEAMQKNLPVSVTSNLRESFFSYPSSLPGFDTSKLYAWQIKAFDLNGYAVNSEIWTFSIEKNRFSHLKTTSAFIRLQKGEDASLFVSDGSLKFQYEHLLPDAVCSYQLIDISTSENRVVRKSEVNVSQGDNFITLDFSGKRFWKEGDKYRFELINSRGEKWILSILFISSDNQ
jgi:hypothetical protein